MSALRRLAPLLAAGVTVMGVGVVAALTPEPAPPRKDRVCVLNGGLFPTFVCREADDHRGGKAP
jgi:hypothetical protein